MKNLFLVEYDRITNLSAPGYDDYEISVFLTNAQRNYIEKKYDPSLNKLGDGFEDSEKRRRELADLIRDGIDAGGTLRTAVSANQNGTHPHGRFFNLPDDLLYLIEERAIITGAGLCNPAGYNINTIKGVAGKYTSILPVTHDYFEANRLNPFKKSNEWLLWRMDFSSFNGKKRVELIGDGTFAIEEYRIRYIAKPSPVITATLTGGMTIEGQVSQQDCKLADITHNEIVRMAVTLALETVGDARYQTQKIESMSNES